MKKQSIDTPALPALLLALALLFPACTEKKGSEAGGEAKEEHADHEHEEGDHEHADHEQEHDQGDHEHADHEGEEGHDHEGHDEKDGDSAKHDHEGDHDHDSVEAGPNGGRILHAVEPHLEFFVTEDRHVRISAVEGDEIVPVTGQTVTVIGGSRSNPTRMSFAKEDGALVSDVAFPEGNDFPVVVRIQASEGAETKTEKFNLDLEDCPTCDYREYACICDHDHEH